MSIQPPPKFEKRVHHVVPQGWQRRFFPVNATGQRDRTGYYRNILTGKNTGPEGPGEKMASEYANIVFDEHYRPSDELEDRIATLESWVIPAIDRIVDSGRIEPFDRVDIARLLGLQAARYPELFTRRLDMARYLAIALGDACRFSDAGNFNDWLQETGMLPGAAFSAAELEALKATDGPQRQAAINTLLQAHGYEAYFNPSLVLSSVETIAVHIAALHWELLAAAAPAFILSDRPVPPKDLGYSFSVALSDRFALRLSKPAAPVPADTVVISIPAQPADIVAINADMRGRAHEWICGPGQWVHSL